MTKRILVVDDEPDFLELLQFRLRNAHYDVTAAANGSEAIAKAREQKPDIILMDLMLPDLDGLTLCEILRRDDATRVTPVILVSALTSLVVQCSAKIAGARAFHGKPLDFEELLMQLEFLLITRELNAENEELATST